MWLLMDYFGFTSFQNLDYCGFYWIHEFQHKFTLLGIWIIVDSTGFTNLSINSPYLGIWIIVDSTGLKKFSKFTLLGIWIIVDSTGLGKI